MSGYERGFYLGLIAVLGLILWNQPACNPTTLIRDTTYLPVHDTTTEHVPVPFAVQGETIVKVHDSLIYRDRPTVVDTAAILADYFQRVYYRDTTKTKYGNIIVEDSLTQNRIQWQHVMAELNIPQVTTTVTKTQPPKGQLYVGFNVGEGLGGNVLWKTKKDHIYSAGYMFNLHGSVFYLSSDYKLSFH